MAGVPKTYFAIALLRERYYKALPGKESLIKIINEVELSDHVYNSNAIENSTLTLEETEKILMQIELSRYVTERELFEAKNLALVMNYIEQRSKISEPSKDLLLLLHKMLLGNIREEIAGRFRNPTEWVRVGNYIAANPVEVSGLLDSMFIVLQSTPQANIIKRIAELHLTFEHIHPFCDGNGRIGRVLNNFILVKEGYVPINIAFSNRADYYDAFRKFDADGSTSKMEAIVGRALSESYHKRLAYLEGKKVITLNEYAKIKKISLSNLINKAHRQTIEAFREKGVWKIAESYKLD